ncbi:hypothetical protein BYT27DRAFT_7204122 [Phlegmacium glaucopus]|nr:hypothetical protein BYT27DRAFT_7204122 [Phlegmacium glaucopus]
MSNSTAPPDVPVPNEILLLVGPLLLGALISFMLFGVSVVQLYMYNLKFSDDKLLIQVSVYVIYVLDIFESVAVAVLAWQSLASGWGRAVSLIFPGWTFSAIPAVTGIVAAWVQIFYAWRIHMMINWIFIPIVIVAIALAQCAAALSIAIGFIPMKSILLLRPMFPRTIAWLGGAAIADVIISISMVYALFSAKKRAFGRTEKVLRRLIRSSVETGVVTTLCTTLELVFFLGLPTTNVHVVFAMMLSKLYSNALMTSLNSRSTGGAKYKGAWNSVSSSQGFEHSGVSLGIIHVSTDVEVSRHSEHKKQIQ